MNDIINTVLKGTGDSDKHLLTLFSIALQIQAKEILELGVREGHTTKPLLNAAHILNANLTSVDIADTSFQPEPHLRVHWNFIKSDALTFLSNNKTKYDLIYIDDWHDGLHVKKEIELLEKFIDNKCIILLHDLMYNNNQPFYNKAFTDPSGEFGNGGPYFAVSSLDKNIWEYCTIPVNHGLTILRKI